MITQYYLERRAHLIFFLVAKEIHAHCGDHESHREAQNSNQKSSGAYPSEMTIDILEWMYSQGRTHVPRLIHSHFHIREKVCVVETSPHLSLNFHSPVTSYFICEKAIIVHTSWGCWECFTSIQ